MHGVGGNSPVYIREYLHFIVSKGFAVVFVPWSTTFSVLQAYVCFHEGFIAAARTNPTIIDTTRVGFTGHSFGGGACYAIAYSLSTTYNWGSNGRFLMPVAQWYTHAITQTELQNFPGNTSLLSIVFDDDVVCDHRMAIDAFQNIAIPLDEKDIVLVTSSVEQSYSYTANHTVVNTNSVFNALDYYVIFRLTDALMDYVFNQNVSAKQVALGDGNSLQITMPQGLNNLIVYDTLSAWHPEFFYSYNCSTPANPRMAYCNIATTIIPASGNLPLVYPIPASDKLTCLNFQVGGEYAILNYLGEVILRGQVHNREFELDVQTLPPGVYSIWSKDSALRFIKQ